MSDTNTGGIGFVGLLTLLFIGLKLTGYIAWSWVWVLCPMWITIIVVVLLLTIVTIFALVIATR